MSEDLIIGLQISVIGLGVTFGALGLLSLVMRLLLRLFPAKKVIRKPMAEASAGSDEGQRLEEMAVALAVGISLLEREGGFTQRDPALGRLLENK